MQRLVLPLFIAITALAIGVVVGRYTIAPAKISSQRLDNRSSTETTTSNPANSSAVPSRDVAVAPDESHSISALGAAKTVFLLAVGVARKEFGDALEKQQEIVTALSDMAIDLFAFESVADIFCDDRSILWQNESHDRAGG